AAVGGEAGRAGRRARVSQLARAVGRAGVGRRASVDAEVLRHRRPTGGPPRERAAGGESEGEDGEEERGAHGWNLRERAAGGLHCNVEARRTPARSLATEQPRRLENSRVRALP